MVRYVRSHVGHTNAFFHCSAGQKINQVQYLATVEAIGMSATMAAVRFDGRIQLHMVCVCVFVCLWQAKRICVYVS